MLIPATLKDVQTQTDFVNGKFKNREYVYVKPSGKEVRARIGTIQKDGGLVNVFPMLGNDDFSTTYVQFNEKTGIQNEPHKLFVRVSDSYGMKIVNEQFQQTGLPPGIGTKIAKYGGRRRTRRRTQRRLTKKRRQ